MRNISIKKFKEALDNKNGELSSLAKSGKKIIGYFCTYTPIEIIHAAGFMPVRVTGDAETLSKVDAHVPNFICPYLRRAFESGLNGQYEYLSGIIQGYTCDVACGLIDMWKENIGGELFHTVPLPYNDNADSRKYLSTAFEELDLKLQNVGGQQIYSNIESSVALYESIRALMMGLYEKRYKGTLPLSGSEFHTVIQTGFTLPPEEYLKMLKKLNADIEEADTKSNTHTPVLISGSIIEEPIYLDIIEASGGRIVGDDLCTGLRHFIQTDTVGHDPMERIIDRHFSRLPCPARSRAVERAHLLMGLTRQSGAKGLIFLFQKFCTPHLADYPVIKDMLDQQGLQSIMLEMDETGAMEGQLQTRLEGFFEVMGKI
ncbi:MAG: 2-hydroxyacyl-CoA dehydratase [Deltaproteobacteria bacterium]|nr:2-hydroxyacyl-CoA dehydratase [Deltaproteobacteria bacterium]